MNDQNLNQQTVKKEYSRLDSIYAWVCLILGYLFCRAFPPMDNPLGMFWVILCIVAVSAVILIKKDICQSKISLVFAVASVLFAFAPMVTVNSGISFLALLCSIVCYCYFVYKLSGNGLEKGLSDFVMVDFLTAIFKFPLGTMGTVFPAMFSGKKQGFRRILKILLGLFIGLIPTTIVAFLLAYDEGFNEIMVSITDYFEDFNILSHLVSLWWGCIVAMYLFGLYASATGDFEAKTTVLSCRERSKKLRFIPILTTIAALVPLVTVYGIFFVSQIDYYISAFSGLLPEGLSYATYAREGFFELCTVSGINMALLIIISNFTHRERKFENVFHKIASVLLSAITIVLIITAMSKMVLYIQTYGLTVKRVLSSWFMVLIGLIFLLVIIKQFVPKLKLIAVSFAVTFIMTLALTLSNYTGIIADFNVDRYIRGDIETVDVSHLSELGSPAVPAMVRLAEYWEANPKEDSESRYSFLKTTLDTQKYYLDYNNGFFEFSITDHRARQELDEYFAKSE